MIRWGGFESQFGDGEKLFAFVQSELLVENLSRGSQKWGEARNSKWITSKSGQGMSGNLTKNVKILNVMTPWEGNFLLPMEIVISNK